MASVLAYPNSCTCSPGQSLLDRCVTTFSQAPGVDELLVVAAAEHAGEIRDRLTATPRLAAVIDGGTARTDSTRHAIDGWPPGTARTA